MAEPLEDANAGTVAKLARISQIARRSGYGEAEAALVDLARENPSSPDVLIALARLLMRQKRYEEAEKAAEKARSIAPMAAGPTVMAGFVQIRLANQARARELFREALRLEPKEARAYFGLATVGMLDEDYEAALECCDRAIDLDPGLERAYELVAEINVRQDRKDLAIAELKALLEENPSNERAIRAYLRLLRSEGRADEALAFLETEVERAPQDRRAIARLARFARREGRADVAVEHYRQLVESGSSRTTDLIRYITALIEAGDLETADREIQALQERRALRPVVSKLRGDIALKANDYEEAIRRYRRACKAVRAPTLPKSDESEADSQLALANKWKAYALSNVRSALRERRAARDR